MHPILDISTATKRFNTPDGKTITALDDVSIAVEQNEFVTLLGPSGCGKTTLLRVISGFEDLESGSVMIDGLTVTHLPAHKRPVNTVFQRYALFPHLNIFRNVAYSLEVAHIPKSEIEDRVGKMLELVGLVGYGSRKVNQLSGGQQQRVALARSLVAQPKILLLDEPLSALDKNLRHKMQQELKTLQEEIGIAFVFVTHDQEEALTMSDRIAVLKDGKIQQVGTPEDLYRRPENEFVAGFIGEGNLFDGTVTSTSGAEAQISLPSGIKFFTKNTGFGIGQELKLLARPEDIVIGDARNMEDLTFNGIIIQVFFIGTDYQIQTSVDGLPPVKAIMRQNAGMHEKIPKPGDQVRLSIPGAALHVIQSTGQR